MSQAKTGEKEELLARLRRVEGQIRGVQRMIEENRDCEAVVTQLMAARAALDRASVLIVDHHLAECLLGEDGPVNRAQLSRIVEFLVKFSNPSSDAAVTGGSDAQGTKSS
jgi:CsoR family transcriptional regulator, copper-sensing transcriptional repressor